MVKSEKSLDPRIMQSVAASNDHFKTNGAIATVHSGSTLDSALDFARGLIANCKGSIHKHL
jgi:hypothetical protein